MAENLEKIIHRKENIESIEPLLSAMRTISLSNWRSALNRAIKIKAFKDELINAYNILLNQGYTKKLNQKKGKQIIIILGSNRGLCGNFNKSTIDFFIQEKFPDRQNQEIILVGTRLIKLFGRHNLNTDRMIEFPEINQIQTLSISLCAPIVIKSDKPRVSVVYNKYIGASKYATVIEEIYPKEILLNEKIDPINSDYYIIDSDPQHMMNTFDYFLFAAELQRCMYSSLAAESSVRFANMENAGKNVDDLITELDMKIQNQRRSKVTTETQELAVSAGLLGSQH